MADKDVISKTFWVPHPDLVFAPLTVKGQDASGAQFVDEEGKSITVKPEEFNMLWRVSKSQLQGVDNVCNLEEVNQGALLHTIRLRYKKNEIYTRVARIVVAVNPFKPLNIYTAKHIDKFAKARDSLDLEPHVYGVGLDAVSGLWNPRKANQAVLISGESGAGKTESTKLVLGFVSEALSGESSKSSDLQDMIMQTTPVLEAFGNAMTVRNNNSSRFGKWIELKVDRGTMSINGCDITDYLLELSRVCNPESQERGYHIFFQLLKNRNEIELKEFGMEGPEAYNYIKDCQRTAPGIDDGRGFEDTKEAFNVLQVGEDVQNEIYRICCAILNLGNAEFVEGPNESSKCTNDDPFKKAAALLKISVDGLKRQTMQRFITIGKEELEAQCNPVQAKAARDGFSKLLYGKLFSWMVKVINQVLKQDCDEKSQFFGVLDIAGFESFEQNSLEQFFINLSNEELQNYFNDYVFRQELDDCEAEGVLQEAKMSFADNADIVELLAGKGGILPMLDEELMIPKASDQTFYNKLLKDHSGHKRFIPPKFTAGSTSFGVEHFAGVVTYSAEGFLEKNTDRPPKEAPALLQSSSLSVLKQIGGVLAEDLREAMAAAAAGKAKKPRTISSKFRESLKALMEKLRSAEPHFIRCVKPNFEKVPGRFDSKMIMEQLAAAGVLETVRIKQEGFIRMPLADFANRYKFLAPKGEQKKIFDIGGPSSIIDQVKALTLVLPAGLSALSLEIPAKSLIVGKTKVFIKRKASYALERGLDLAVIGHVVNLQRIVRGRIARKKFNVLRYGVTGLIQFENRNLFYREAGSEHIAITKLLTTAAIMAEVAIGKELLKAAESLPAALPHPARVKRLVNRMESEAKTIDRLAELKTTMDPVELEKAVVRADELEIPNLQSHQKRLADLKAQLPVITAMKEALESQDIPALQNIFDAVRRGELTTELTQKDWLPELRGLELAAEVHNTLEELKAKKRLNDAKTKLVQETYDGVFKQARVKKPEKKKSPEDGVPASQEDDGEEADEGAAGAEGEEGFDEQRQRIMTLTGLTPEQQDNVLACLVQAGETCDVEMMEKEFAVAVAQGISAEDLKDAEEMFMALQKESFICQRIKEESEKAANPSTATGKVLKCLKNLLSQAKTMEIPEEYYSDGGRALQTGVINRVRKTVRGSILDDDMMKDPEMKLFEEDIFSDLYKFPGLKAASRWKGHANRYRAAKRETMLAHSRNLIKEALTKVPSSVERTAQLVFSDILGWMLDRPLPECQRLGLGQDIVDTAKGSLKLADEIYVQVMKQLTQNPSKRSSMLGWDMLLSLCQQVCPSQELLEFVRTFLMQAISAGTIETAGAMQAEIAEKAKQCLKDVNISDAPSRVADGEDLVPVQVTLIDSSTRKLHVGPATTLLELGEKLSEQLKINRAKDFSFFELSEESLHGPHTLLPDTTLISSVLLPGFSYGKSNLLYKRRFLLHSEQLNPSDLAHATLTYRQALFDYLHYPFCENTGLVCQIAATILYLEADHYSTFIVGDSLKKHDMLEQIMPNCMVPEAQRGKKEKLLSWIGMGSEENKQRSKYATQLANEYTKLKIVLDKEEPRLLQMSRVMSMMQETWLFGTRYWWGRLLPSVPDDRVPLPDMELRYHCPYDFEYFICVDIWGLRFISGEPSPHIQYAFLFAEEAEMRVTQWEEKDNIVQFVVQTSEEPDVKSSVFVECTGAREICYTMDMACSDGRSLARDRCFSRVEAM